MFTTQISSEHTPLNSVNIINVSNAILINWKYISVYQVLSPGYLNINIAASSSC